MYKISFSVHTKISGNLKYFHVVTLAILEHGHKFFDSPSIERWSYISLPLESGVFLSVSVNRVQCK